MTVWRGRLEWELNYLSQEMQPRQAGEGSGKLEMPDDRLEREDGMGIG
jgi:hypothetical protein